MRDTSNKASKVEVEVQGFEQKQKLFKTLSKANERRSEETEPVVRGARKTQYQGILGKKKQIDGENEVKNKST